MEDYVLDIIIGKGPSARSLRMDLPPFTLIGATTRAGSLSSPLRDRFGIIERLQFYSTDELAQIIDINARHLDVPIESDGARLIASRSRGTPRIANRLLNRVRDFAQVEGEGVINAEIARYALDRLEVDEAGLDKLDRDLLLTIMDAVQRAALSAWTPLPPASAKSALRSRMSASLISCRKDSSRGRRADASLQKKLTTTFWPANTKTHAGAKSAGDIVYQRRGRRDNNK